MIDNSKIDGISIQPVSRLYSANRLTFTPPCTALIGMWVKLLKVPYTILFPFILLFCLVGAYTVDNKIFDIYIMTMFGFVGYLLRKYKYEAAPLILAFVLGPMLEDALRQSLIMSDGNPAIFFRARSPRLR